MIIGTVIFFATFFITLKALQYLDERSRLYEEELELIPVRQFTDEEMLKQRTKYERLNKEI